MTAEKVPTTEPAMPPTFGEFSSIRLTAGLLEEEITLVLVVEEDDPHWVVD